mmetsp:Transcript_19511/g.35881  ORF Transcript_19511/g.35881 Transcript_19511/m.35881 type:complete len:105 (+) Transcript_19511:757-1071(+)
MKWQVCVRKLVQMYILFGMVLEAMKELVPSSFILAQVMEVRVSQRMSAPWYTQVESMMWRSSWLSPLIESINGKRASWFESYGEFVCLASMERVLSIDMNFDDY